MCILQSATLEYEWIWLHMWHIWLLKCQNSTLVLTSHQEPCLVHWEGCRDELGMLEMFAQLWNSVSGGGETLSHKDNWWASSSPLMWTLALSSSYRPSQPFQYNKQGETLAGLRWSRSAEHEVLKHEGEDWVKKTEVEASRWPKAGKLLINPQGAVLLVGYKKKKVPQVLRITFSGFVSCLLMLYQNIRGWGNYKDQKFVYAIEWRL